MKNLIGNLDGSVGRKYDSQERNTEDDGRQITR
jgi:hypothetical protein